MCTSFPWSKPKRVPLGKLIRAFCSLVWVCLCVHQLCCSYVLSSQSLTQVTSAVRLTQLLINTTRSMPDVTLSGIPVTWCVTPSSPRPGTCCDNLEEPPALMKMGLSLILVGHVNFLLGAVVHGIVLQQINLHEKVRGMGYAISNVVTLFSGMLVSAEQTLRRSSELLFFPVFFFSSLFAG